MSSNKKIHLDAGYGKPACDAKTDKRLTQDESRVTCKKCRPKGASK